MQKMIESLPTDAEQYIHTYCEVSAIVTLTYLSLLMEVLETGARRLKTEGGGLVGRIGVQNI